MSILQQAYAQDDCGVADFVDHKLNTSHAAIGYIIARNWNLPDEVCEAIRLPYTKLDELDLISPGCVEQLVVSLSLAQDICDESGRLAGVKSNRLWPNTADQLFQYLCLSEDDYTDLREDIREQIELCS